MHAPAETGAVDAARAKVRAAITPPVLRNDISITPRWPIFSPILSDAFSSSILNCRHGYVNATATLFASSPPTIRRDPLSTRARAKSAYPMQTADLGAGYQAF